mgnify:CR=1 FL=1
MPKLAQRTTVRRLLGSWGSVLCLGLLLTSPAGAAEAPRAVSFVNDVVPVLKEMKRQGKGVIGMKILGAGGLRPRVDEALRYALASPVLDCFTIGAESRTNPYLRLRLDQFLSMMGR